MSYTVSIATVVFVLVLLISSSCMMLPKKESFQGLPAISCFWADPPAPMAVATRADPVQIQQRDGPEVVNLPLAYPMGDRPVQATTLTPVTPATTVTTAYPTVIPVVTTVTTLTPGAPAASVLAMTPVPATLVTLAPVTLAPPDLMATSELPTSYVPATTLAPVTQITQVPVGLVTSGLETSLVPVVPVKESFQARVHPGQKTRKRRIVRYVIPYETR